MTAPDRPKVYVYAVGRLARFGDLLVVAVDENGVCLAEHVCSSMAWARHDLHDEAGRHDVYASRFGGWGDGEFYDLVVLAGGEVPPPAVVEAIRARNAELAQQERDGEGQ